MSTGRCLIFGAAAFFDPTKKPAAFADGLPRGGLLRKSVIADYGGELPHSQGYNGRMFSDLRREAAASLIHSATMSA